MFWVLLYAALTNIGVAIGVVVVSPAFYAVTLALITRALTARFHWWWCIAVTATVFGFGTTLSIAGVGLPWFGSIPALPFTALVALGAATASLVTLSGLARLVGVAALAVQLVVIAVPLVSLQVQRGERDAAADRAEIARRDEMNTQPFILPGYTIRYVSPSSYESVVYLSADPDATTRDDFHLDDSDITISAAPTDPTLTLQSEVCRWILDPDVGGSPGNTCDQITPDTWALDTNGIASVVRIRGTQRIEIVDPRTDSAGLIALADRATLMTDAGFTDWNTWLLDQDKRV
ncbi:hypothetical protein [Subtercola boreus]|uniref:hypothetical protein n=1 Tax=Subtercola boreus TaxID=120213 RepID=UPI0011C0302E|nr:hypothetical protein [Subtercola boreus]